MYRWNVRGSRTLSTYQCGPSGGVCADPAQTATRSLNSHMKYLYDIKALYFLKKSEYLPCESLHRTFCMQSHHAIHYAREPYKMTLISDNR